MSIAYLSNSFPEASEGYVWEEADEFRRRGWDLIACSCRTPRSIAPQQAALESECLYLFPIRPLLALQAVCVMLLNLSKIRDLIVRAVRGPEPAGKRLRTLAHTWLGACLAVRLRPCEINHIHAHHGYFSSWAGMVAARLLRASFSMTLHGSDLLVRADYLDTKLKNCSFCVTVSEFNRDYILRRYPECAAGKVLVHRIGVDLNYWRPSRRHQDHCFTMVSVGRLHRVKNHGFLLLACRELKIRGVKLRCLIAGDGPEHDALAALIAAFDLSREVTLLGSVARHHVRELYAQADVVVLTSHSEGIPVSLMEAMAMERTVLAPAITGIPELIINGKTGFLYQPNSLHDFLEKLENIRRAGSLGQLGRVAREHVERHFNRSVNQTLLVTAMIKQMKRARGVRSEVTTDENSLLQQIQFPIQRNRSLPV